MPLIYDEYHPVMVTTQELRRLIDSEMVEYRTLPDHAGQAYAVYVPRSGHTIHEVQRQVDAWSEEEE